MGSGREFTLHFFSLSTFQTYRDRRLPPGRSPDLRIWLWGGHVPTPTPGTDSQGRSFYSKQDCPRIGLVDVFCGWECSPTLVA